MWHTRRNPLKKLARSSEKVDVVRDGYRRKLHKAFLRYHDPENWEILREALKRMGRSDLIGNTDRHLVPRYNPPAAVAAMERRRETPSADKIAKKFGQNKPRPGAAIVRTPTGAKPARKGATGTARGKR
jgi:hypothetical protein